MQFDSYDTSTVLLYGGGALVALWLSSVFVGAIDSIPLVRMCVCFGLIPYLFWNYEQILYCSPGN